MSLKSNMLLVLCVGTFFSLGGCEDVFDGGLDNDGGFVEKAGTSQCAQVDEGGTATLSCPSGQVIASIDFASYGTPTGSCPSFSSSSCHASSSKSTVEAGCLNKQSCTVGANNGVFGDPCVGTYKKLAVAYSCQSPNAAQCAEGNEGSTAALSCPSGQVIKSIAFASYGTPTGSCPNFSNSSCHASNSKSKVEAACLNKQSCTVGANNGVFGDPCVGTYKKLAVAYSCSGGDTDQCPNDPNKTSPGICGCGTPDTDSDGDGTANCKDNCPTDPSKTQPGVCGCGKAEGTCDSTCADNSNFIDAQGYRCSDWVGYDCNRATEDYGYTAAQETQIVSNCKKSCNLCSGTDQCPNDPNKTSPGICGCGTPDTDSDGDGTANCQDNCPTDPSKTQPGVCGCGKAEGTCGGSTYNVYYGMLHNHTNISDGTGTPAAAYKYARDVSKLDFFGIADHDYYPNEMTASDWNTIKSAAESYNQDGTFATFWGFEWTSDTTEYQSNGLNLGHIAIINSSDFCVSTWSQTRTLNQLMTWLSTRDAIAFLNHPGQYDTTFDKFEFTRSEKVVGMELWNRNADFSYYYNDGFYSNDGNLGYFDEALKRGWYIGASGSEDNHSGTWGSGNARMAVLATEKTRTSIYAALKSRRFYSTLDKNLVLSFTANGAQMGSKISAGSLNIEIKASDGNNEAFSKIRLLKNGVGVQEWSPNSVNPVVTTTQSAVNGNYFYVIVRQSDGNEAISSPIFIN